MISKYKDKSYVDYDKYSDEYERLSEQLLEMVEENFEIDINEMEVLGNTRIEEINVFLCENNKNSLYGESFSVENYKNPILLKQVYKKEELITLDKQKVAGGNGTLHGKFAFTRDMVTEDEAIKEIGWMTLNKGESIGVHPHKNNEDTYIIVSGEGIFTDGSGKETVVKAGDVTIARPNQSHGLRNEKDEPLVFLDIIAQNHALKIEK